MIRRIKLFENFDQYMNEGYVKNLMILIQSTEGDADKDPSKQWTSKEAIDWAVGFQKEFGLWHPDDSAHDIIWDDKKPTDLDKVENQMDNFCNVNWESIGVDIDQYVIAGFIQGHNILGHN